MIAHITYTDANMTISAGKAKDSALKFGAETSRICSVNDIDPYFKLINYEVLNAQRGAGYWLWKPYIILKELYRMKEGDFLVYTDAGVEVVNDLKIITDKNVDIFLFGNNYEHEHWCKGKVMDEVFKCSGNQVQASAMFFKVGKASRDFVKRWLLFCEMPGLIDDSESDGNHLEFQEHRHDQAIVTALAYKYGIDLHWWPAMYLDGAFHYDKGSYTDSYPIIFHHHRKRNHEWK